MVERKARLLLVEDDQQLGALIEGVLTEYYNVVLVTDGTEALKVGIAEGFDIVVLDRGLPALDGLSVVQGLRNEGITSPILILTALGSVSDKVDGLDAGANDYLVKPFDFQELLARLRALTRTLTAGGPVFEIGDWEFYPADYCIYSPHTGRILLTPRERDLLKLFVQNPDRTFSRREILRGIFQSTDQPGTVDTYVHYLRRKTDKDVILTVRAHGYRLGLL